MYVHIGGDCTLSDKFIVAVCDFEALSARADKKALSFLKAAEEEGRLEALPGSLPLSVVVTLEKIYLSPLSPTVIDRRLRSARNEGNII